MFHLIQYITLCVCLLRLSSTISLLFTYIIAVSWSWVTSSNLHRQRFPLFFLWVVVVEVQNLMIIWTLVPSWCASLCYGGTPMGCPHNPRWVRWVPWDEHNTQSKRLDFGKTECRPLNDDAEKKQQTSFSRRRKLSLYFRTDTKNLTLSFFE